MPFFKKKGAKKTVSDKELKRVRSESTASALATNVGDVKLMARGSVSDTLPEMPSKEVLESNFDRLMNELALPPTKIEEMRKWPDKRKWMLICQHKTKVTTDWVVSKVSTTPQYFLSILKMEPESIQVKELRVLRVSLTSNLVSWVNQFLDLNGHEAMLTLISTLEVRLRKEAHDWEILSELINCVKALMNQQNGFRRIISTRGAMDKIALALDTPDLRIRAVILSILASVALVPPTGHQLVLEALRNFARVKREPSRFFGLVHALNTALDAEGLHSPSMLEEYALWTITLINTIVNTPQEIKRRVALRKQFIRLGLTPLIDKISSDFARSQPIKTQLDIFSELSEADSQELPAAGAAAADDDNSDTEGLSGSATALYRGSVSANSAVSVPASNAESGDELLRLVRALKAALSMSPDDMSVFKTAIQSLAEGIPSLDAPSRTARLRLLVDVARGNTPPAPAANGPAVSPAVDTLQAEIDKLRARESEVIRDYEARLASVQTSLRTLSARVDSLLAANQRLEAELAAARAAPPVSTPSTSEQPTSLADNPPASSGPPPPPLPTNTAESMSTTSTPPPPPLPNGGGPPPPPPPPSSSNNTDDPMSTMSTPPPPPPPGPGGPPPPPPGPGGPPPPPGPGLAVTGRKKLPPKAGPKPSVKVKNLNWTKLADNAVAGSFWEKAGDVDLGDSLRDLEELFAAKTTPTAGPAAAAAGADGAADDSANAGEEETLPPISVLDVKRSNAVGITIARLKASFAEIRSALLSADDNVLTLDQLKALEKLTPTNEEKEQLRAVAEVDRPRLNKPEKFFLEIMDIPRLSEKISCWIFSRKFDAALAEVRPEVSALLQACRELRQSAKLRRLLEWVLALGNFLNAGGFRGGAYGFKLDALGRLEEVRSGDGKTNLLQFLIKRVDAVHPDVLQPGASWWEEVPNVANAKKVAVSTVQTEISELRKGIAAVKNELDAVDAAPEPAAAEFHRKLRAFYDRAAAEVTAVEAEFAEAIEAIKTTLVYFGEQPTASPEEFFGVFANFKAAIDKAKKELMKMEEAEKRKAAQAAASANSAGRGVMMPVMSPVSPRRKKGASVSPSEGAINAAAAEDGKGVMDGLIEALKGGDAFSNLRKTRRPPTEEKKPEPAVANEAMAMLGKLKKSQPK